MKPTTAHVLAVTLFCAFEVLGFVQANPALATQLHITSQVLLVAGFVIALASKELFGTPVPTDPGATKKPPTVPPAAVSMLCILALGLGVCGCSSKLPSDLEQIAGCVVGDVVAGQTDLAAIAHDCSGGIEQTAADAIALLLDSPSFTAAHPALVPALQQKLADYRQAHPRP